MKPAIHTEGLSKRYGGTLALDRLDLMVGEGEVYGYLGPNGPARRPRSACCWGCTARATDVRSCSASTRGAIR